MEKAPFPHSGFPELLKTRDGTILHIGTDGVWQTADGGTHWSKLDVPGSPYYPRATQLNDGRILVVGHVGGDDEYGKVDQSIVQQTFRLQSTQTDKPGNRIRKDTLMSRSAACPSVKLLVGACLLPSDGVAIVRG